MLRRWVIGGDEDGIEGAGLGTPGDGDLVSGGFAEAVQLLGGGGVGNRRRLRASASSSDSPAASACSMWTSLTSPARGISVTRKVAGRCDVSWCCSPCRPAHRVHVHVGAAASERTGCGVLPMTTSYRYWFSSLSAIRA